MGLQLGKLLKQRTLPWNGGMCDKKKRGCGGLPYLQGLLNLKMAVAFAFDQFHLTGVRLVLEVMQAVHCQCTSDIESSILLLDWLDSSDTFRLICMFYGIFVHVGDSHVVRSSDRLLNGWLCKELRALLHSNRGTGIQ